jgi:hypothetical protein
MMNSNSLTPSKKQVLTWSIAASPASPPKCCSSFVPRGQCLSYLFLYTCSIFHFTCSHLLQDQAFCESLPGTLACLSNFIYHNIFFKITIIDPAQWLKNGILATWEAAIRRIAIQGQLRGKVGWTQS